MGQTIHGTAGAVLQVLANYRHRVGSSYTVQTILLQIPGVSAPHSHSCEQVLFHSLYVAEPDSNALTLEIC